MLSTLIAQTLWFFLPAMVANMAPVFAARFDWLPVLNSPIDFYLTWRGKRLLGDNKTIRGFVVAIFFGAATGLAQYLFQRNINLYFDALVPNYSIWYALLFGGWLGLAALTGDAVKSFFKRQFNIAPGQSWMPWDQIDIVIGCTAFTFWFTQLSIVHVAIALIIIGCGMYFFSAVGTSFGIKKSL